MSSDVSALFRPFELGSLRLSNRIVMAPMTRNRSPGGVPTAEVAAYYARRARGGVGLIMTEGTAIDHPAANGYEGVPYLFGKEALAGWRAVVEAVHAEGGKIFPQLWHVGGLRRPEMPPQPGVPGHTPSGLAKPGGRAVCHAMSESDIADTIAGYARSAASAREVGFDGIEIHGAHGYLIDQFFWESLNQRTDGWGGSLEARSRFALEVVRAIRKAVGPDYPVCFRYSQWKLHDYAARIAHTPEELARIVVPLSEAGVDIFHCSTRRFFLPEFEGSPLNLAGWTKKLTGKPTITVGSVGIDIEFATDRQDDAPRTERLATLCRRLDAEEYDLVAIGRALIGDPEWPRKIRETRGDDVRLFDKSLLAQLV
jgi:2,4-dienoyl-CoA reductase-like NADH-dependent reductase (Old Yellow Enzyme family)